MCVCTVAQPGVSAECASLRDSDDDYRCVYYKSLGHCSYASVADTCQSTCFGCPANVLPTSSCDFYTSDPYSCYLSVSTSPTLTMRWNDEDFKSGTVKEMCAADCADATCVDTDNGATSNINGGTGCSGYYRSWCDISWADNSEFTASSMCCICGGGATPSPPAEGSATLGYTLDVVDAHALQPGGEGSSTPLDQQANVTAEAEAKASAEAKVAEAAAAAAHKAEAARREAASALANAEASQAEAAKLQSELEALHEAREKDNGYDK